MQFQGGVSVLSVFEPVVALNGRLVQTNARETQPCSPFSYTQHTDVTEHTGFICSREQRLPAVSVTPLGQVSDQV